jgi:hypothetical protein
MSSPVFEAFLARLYCDEAFLRSFLNDPSATALSAGLSDVELLHAREIKLDQLKLAARSYAKKRSKKERPSFLKQLFRR